MSDNQISLYFHIPFCTRKCSYCHFYVIPDKDPHKLQLMEGFIREWELWFPQMHGKKVVSIYFGGGTPALFGAEFISRLIELVKSSLDFDVNNLEITLEANPENITLELMKAYAQAGINRVSIGIQTLDNALLHTLGRIHEANKALDAVYTTASSGISNISIDLMYDLPGQTLATWKNTLVKSRELPITHLSLYNLTIEPHTVFFKYKDNIEKQLPDQQTSLHMYEMAIDLLSEDGLVQYEISAFAKNNAFSRHNVGYWTARPFLGFGPSAFSYWEGKRFRNIANLNKYCNALENKKMPIDFEELLDPEASRRELLVIQLRLLAGVDIQEFQKQHGLLDSETLKIISELVSDDYLSNKDTLKLTKKGILFYDTVASELI